MAKWFLFKLMIIAAISLTSLTEGKCQNLAALDNNNGFKNFKFGMHKLSLGQRQYIVVENGSAEMCTISDVEPIGDIYVKEAKLYFIDEKLAKIEVYFNHSASENVISAFKSAFGEGQCDLSRKDDGTYHQTCKWKGQKVSLKLYSFSYIPRFNPKDPTGNMKFKEYVLFVEYELVGYKEMLEKYRSKKYDPSKF